jgi:secreted PhoX family phosphatase
LVFASALLAAGAQAQQPGLQMAIDGAQAKIIFSTYAHTHDDGSQPRGLFDGLVWIPDGDHQGNRGWLFMNNELTISNDPSGAVTRLRYENGRVTAAEVWVSGLARPCSAHDTPWRTVLTNEEDDGAENGEFGYPVEIDPLNKNNWRRVTAMGRASWEQSLAYPLTGEFYLSDDSRPTSGAGAIYKFVPDRFGDLSSGRLYAFKADGGVKEARTTGTWIEIADPVNAQAEALEKGATLYDRPEDLEYNPVDGHIYWLMTGDSRAEDESRRLGAVYRFDPRTNTMERWLEATGANGLAMPDNLEIDPKGNLWITEDGDGSVVEAWGNNDLVLVRPDKSIQTVMRGQDSSGEVSGILWKPDGTGFWVEWQHGQSDDKANGEAYDELYEVTLPASFQAPKPWIYASTAATAVSQVKDAPLPSAFGLDQNYPNPFNPETTIRFHLAADALVTLAVYNAAGQKVATLAAEHMQAGTYQATWDGRNDAGNLVASGTYMYKLQAGDQVQSRQMVFLK